ncbi:hypothetical protein J3R82DRAFT_4735, partial [Butyriboletus roseoflavus]
ELCTLFFHLTTLLAISSHVIFVFDGPHWPLMKQEKHNWKRSYWLVIGFQLLLGSFGL